MYFYYVTSCLWDQAADRHNEWGLYSLPSLYGSSRPGVKLLNRFDMVLNSILKYSKWFQTVFEPRPGYCMYHGCIHMSVTHIIKQDMRISMVTHQWPSVCRAGWSSCWFPIILSVCWRPDGPGRGCPPSGQSPVPRWPHSVSGSHL
jgi:hypothetical protein